VDQLSNGLAEHGSDADGRKSSDPGEENKHYIDDARWKPDCGGTLYKIP